MNSDQDTQESKQESPPAPDSSHGSSERHDEVPHVHEEVKDVDELIAAMDRVDEGMPEDEEDETDEELEPAKTPSKDKQAQKDQPKEPEELRQAKERLSHIKSKLLTLQWDVQHGQINPAKKAMYEKLKQEGEALARVINESAAKE